MEERKDTLFQGQISIGEGDTPVVRSRFIGPSLGIANLYFKLENLNPTGSYKDRFAAAFVNDLLAKKTTLCLATSSGNTGAALSAYCAAAGVECLLVLVDGAPISKVQQIQVYGSKTITVEGFGKDTATTRIVFDLLQASAKLRDIPFPVSAYCYCPQGMSGVETIVQEVSDQLDVDIHHLFSPAGGGGLTLAMANGVMRNAKLAQRCKVHCVQPAGNNTIAGPLRQGLQEAHAVDASTTHISGLQVPGVLDGTQTLLRCRQTGGNGYVVTDDEVFEVQRELALREGIFCEAAGAVSVCGFIKAVRHGEVFSDETIVCLVTGSGFKEFPHVSERFRLAAEQNRVDLKGFEKMLSNI